MTRWERVRRGRRILRATRDRAFTSSSLTSPLFQCLDRQLPPGDSLPWSSSIMSNFFSSSRLNSVSSKRKQNNIFSNRRQSCSHSSNKHTFLCSKSMTINGPNSRTCKEKGTSSMITTKQSKPQATILSSIKQSIPFSSNMLTKSSNQQYKSHQTCNSFLRLRVRSKKTLWSFSQRRTRLLLCRQTFKGDLQPPGQQTSMTSS